MDGEGTHFVNRRTLLAGATILPAAGCQSVADWINNSPDINAANLRLLIGYVKAIAAGLAAVVPVVVSAGWLPSATAAQAVTGLVAVQGAADAIAGASDIKGAQTVKSVQVIGDFINSAVDVAAAIPTLPAQVRLPLVAAAALLPIIESLVGLFLAPHAPVVATAAPLTAAPATAVTILQNAAAHPPSVP